MEQLGIDIETYSDVSLQDCGVAKYIASPVFEIMLFSFSCDGAEPITVDLIAGEFLPSWVSTALVDPRVLKTAHNAAFEIGCIERQFNIKLELRQWRCTMVYSSMLGLPLKLDLVAKVLHLDQQKESTGKALIKLFCTPTKITKAWIKKAPIEELYPIFKESWTNFILRHSGMSDDDKDMALIDPELYYFRDFCKEGIVLHDFFIRTYPKDAPEKWFDFKAYNKQDVVVEQAILKVISWFKIPEFEKNLWILDQKINKTGITLAHDLAIHALEINEINRRELIAEAIELTGVENPNSGPQLMGWLNKTIADETDDLDIPLEIANLKKDGLAILKKEIKEMGYESSTIIDRVISIRQELSKTSIKKYVSMLESECVDGRMYDILQFYGANRTGRWAGRRVQPQNYPRIEMSSADLDLVRRIVVEGRKDAKLELEVLFSNVPYTLSQLLRTAFVPRLGNRLIVADFSAIEARVISWLAKEEWRLQVFRTHGKIYEASCAAMFKVSLDRFKKTDGTFIDSDDLPKDLKELRQRGKIAELALGYQGAENALITMDIKKKLKKEELKPLVEAWRAANPKIVKMWYEVNDAAINALESGEKVTSYGLTFFVKNKILFMVLPSGRPLCYWNPSLQKQDCTFVTFNEPRGKYKKGQCTLMPDGDVESLKKLNINITVGGKKVKKSIIYEGLDQKTNTWHRLATYGGKLIENAVQGIARDLLAEKMVAVDKAGYVIALHVHDEIVSDMPDGAGSLKEVCDIMSQEPKWAKGLPLGAAGFEGYYYKK